MSPDPVSEESLESLVGRIADEFTERLDRAEGPDIEDYARRFPQVADVIRQTFPALQTMWMLGRPAVDEMQGSDGEPAAGILGDFRIVREIGRGGMGVVYEAEQISLGRPVALKVLPFAAVLDARQLQRFRNEAQAAAQLHHANIVPVYTVGCERGVYYYAMQYIEGRTLAEVIEELRGLTEPASDGPCGARPPISEVTTALLSRTDASTGSDAAASPGEARPTPGGSSEQRLGLSGEGSTRTRAFFQTAAALGSQAAMALEHAHRLGVVHRDIKPSNLLLDATGNVWVTDFGLASVRRQDETITMPGDVLGTLRYMSPEQANGRSDAADPRADVYSLGVTLYELLTLRAPFIGDNRHELLRRIVEQDPPSPRRFNRALPADLETILLKALAKDPADRYATAGQMAEDLQRFRERRPILARPPSLLERLAKWSGRHMALVGTTLAALLLIAAGLMVSTVLIAREQARTTAALGLARQARQRSDANLQEALGAVDRMLTQVGRDQLARVPTAVRRQWLTDALRFYQGFLREQGTDPKIRLETARTYRRIGDIQTMLAGPTQAEQSYRRGIDGLEAAAPLALNPAEYQYELALCLRQLGLLQRDRADADAGRPALARSTAILAGLVAASPQTPCFWQPLAQNYLDTGQLREAEQALQHAVALQEDAASGQSDRAYDREALAQISHDLGQVLQQAGRYPEASAAYAKALELYTSASASPDDPRYHGQIGLLHLHIGESFRQAGRHGDAEPHLHKALEFLKPASQESSDLTSPDSPRRNLARAYMVLADVMRLTDRPWDAMKALSDGLNVQAGLVRELPGLSGLQADLEAGRAAQDELLLQTGGYAFLRPVSRDEALAMRDSVSLLERMVEQVPTDPQYREKLALRLLGLGMAEQWVDSGGKAVALYRQAQLLWERLVAEYPDVPRYREYLAVCCRMTGQILSMGPHLDHSLDQSEKAFARAVEIWRALHDDPATRQRYFGQLLGELGSLGRVIGQQGRLVEAEQLLVEAVRMSERGRTEFPGLETAWPYCRTVIATWSAMAEVMERMQRLEQAEQYYARIIPYARDRATTSQDPSVFMFDQVYAGIMRADLLRRMDRKDDAVGVLAEATESWEPLAARSPDDTAVLRGMAITNTMIAIRLWELRKIDLAEKVTARVLDSLERLSTCAQTMQIPVVLHDYARHRLVGHLAGILTTQGRLALAEEVGRRGIRAQMHVADQFPDLPWVRCVAGRLQMEMGDVYYAVRQYDKAAAETRLAIAALEPLARDFPDDWGFRFELGAALRNLGQILIKLERFQEAEQACRDGIATRRSMMRDFPDEPVCRRAFCAEQQNLVWFLSRKQQWEEVDTICRETVPIVEGLLVSQPDDQQLLRTLSRWHFIQADSAVRTNQLDQAEACHAKAMQAARQALAVNPEDIDSRLQLARSFASIGGFHEGTTLRLGEAEQAYRQALQVFLDLASDYPKQAEYSINVVNWYRNLGDVLRRAGRMSDAEQAFREGLAVQQDMVSRFPNEPDVLACGAFIRQRLYTIAMSAARLAEAEQMAREELAIWHDLNGRKTAMGLWRVERVANLARLAKVLTLLGRHDEAAGYYRQAAQLAETLQTDPALNESRRAYLEELLATASQPATQPANAVLR